MRVIVTGSRNWTDRTGLHLALDTVILGIPCLRLGLDIDGLRLPAAGATTPHVVVHGGCPTGADAHTEEWWTGHRDLDIARERFPADWDACGADCPADSGAHRQPRRSGDIHHPGQLPTYCPGAGPRRNWTMAAAGADLALAFLQPDQPNRGTRNCIRACERAGIPVRRIVGTQPDQENRRA